MPTEDGYFKKGNKLAANHKIVRQALVRAIKQRDLQKGDGETLRSIAESLIDKAIEGDVQSYKELRDTLDGKPAQSLSIDANVTAITASELTDDQLAQKAMGDAG